MKPVYIEVSAGVRYWDDATINEQTDDEGTLTPFRRGDLWCPVIRLADGLVMDWPAGMTADLHFKVCDAGEYWLLDEGRQRVAKWGSSYVPDEFLCHGDTGYGDYIILNVGGDGLIKGYKAAKVELACSCEEDDQDGWKPLAEKGGAA